MSYGRFFACGNKLLFPTMEPDLTIVMTLVKTRFLIKKIICHGIEWLGLANFPESSLETFLMTTNTTQIFVAFIHSTLLFVRGNLIEWKKKTLIWTRIANISDLFYCWFFFWHDGSCCITTRLWTLLLNLCSHWPFKRFKIQKWIKRTKTLSTLTQSYHFLWYFNLGRNHGRRESRWKV